MLSRESLLLINVYVLYLLYVSTIAPGYCSGQINIAYFFLFKRLSGLVVSVLAYSAGGRGFKPRAGQT